MHRNDGGQSTVELALIAPILAFALLGGVDLMRVAAIQQAMQNAARVGAEVASIDATTTDDTIRSRIADALSGTPGLGSPTIHECVGSPSSPVPPAAGAAPCSVLSGGGSNRSGSGVYQGTPQSGIGNCYASAAANLCFVNVRVIYTFKTTINWPYVPNLLTIDRDASLAIQQ